jgi:hypothetical protein
MHGNDDITTHTYHRATNSARNRNGEKLSYIHFYQGTSRTRAARMWYGDNGDGKFTIRPLWSHPGGDFAGASMTWYFTPDLETVRRYAEYIKPMLDPGDGVCLVRIEVPKEELNRIRALSLRYPSENWKRVVFASRSRSFLESKDLARKLESCDLLVGDIATHLKRHYRKLADWS